MERSSEKTPQLKPQNGLMHPRMPVSREEPACRCYLPRGIDDVGARGTVLSEPIGAESGTVSIFVALPLQRQTEPLGHLAMEIRAGSLLSDVLGQKIGLEFGFSVLDEGQTLIGHELHDSSTSL